ENNYRPSYEISEDKRKIVTELRKLVKGVETVWLASDEDREGEAIAWHLAEVLKLKEDETKRIVFHEITKDAILNAITQPRKIDTNLVNSQQARRILDRLVGFELSPVLWRKVKPSLSAGRVQSVSVRLLVEREREIQDFKSTSSYKVSAVFEVRDGKKKEILLKAELAKRIPARDEVLEFLDKCKSAEFKVADIVTKPSKKSPAAPFTTSTLQQEASRKLGFSVSQTMRVAQKLYEAGKITYMRTDSVNLSTLAIAAAKKEITDEFGKKYVNTRQYKTKNKSAQEAHEAIRPSYMNKHEASGSQQEKKLYDLIWKRTIASQMSDAQLEKTTVNINISNSDKRFVARGEVLIFDGFLKVYLESTDAEPDDEKGETKGLLPPVKVDDMLAPRQIEAVERFSQRPARYTEASLVKKLEELGIGRPSTYAPTISTIQLRGYVEKDEREGTPRDYSYISLTGKDILEETRTEITGADKNKLFPTDIGMVVNDFLVEHFQNIMDYNFTASVEKEFDEIARGNLVWYEMIDHFYKPFHKKVAETIETSERKAGERKLGIDPKTEKPVFVRIGRYGPMAQLGESPPQDAPDDADFEKPRYAKLQKDQRLETITFEEALELFKLPRTVGQFEDSDVVIAVGRFGPYARHKSAFYGLKKGEDNPLTITLERSIQLIEEKREADKNKIIQVFEENEELRVLNGRWGPYVSYEKKNYKIPKDVDPKTLSLEDCLKLVEEGKKNPKTRGKAKTATKTKAAAKPKAVAKTKAAAKPKAAAKKKAAAKPKAKAKPKAAAKTKAKPKAEKE
ncbi:MAG: type I DNA topoisomerase, partial [bacterium]|nr:type I DNA topoisomerase [bacterium]